MNYFIRATGLVLIAAMVGALGAATVLNVARKVIKNQTVAVIELDFVPVNTTYGSRTKQVN